jgi:DNA ligase-1
MLRILLFALLIIPPVSIATPPKLALANRYHDQIDISQYLVSEKLDGVRGYWDGQNLYTRNGNLIHAPLQFTKNWPNTPLDGELWIARGRFEEVSGIVRRKTPNPEDWQPIRFMVFDVHDSNVAFEQRIQLAKQLIEEARNPSLQLIPQLPVLSAEELSNRLKTIVEQGGEGLMLHRKNALYLAGRSDDILKLKPRWDAEARVIAHIPGKGKYQGMLGSLLVEGISESQSRGRQFRIGTGFSDAERQNPPAIGAVISYQFQGYTNKGIPRFTSFLRVRHDREML